MGMIAARHMTLWLGSLALGLLCFADALPQQGVCAPDFVMMAEHSAPDAAARVHVVAQHPTGPAPTRVSADASPPRVSIEVKLIDLRGEEERALTLGRLLDAQPTPSATNSSSAQAQRLAMRPSLKDDPHLSAILDALDEPQTNRTAELDGSQLDWPGRHLTNAANIRLSAELGPAASAVLTDSQCRLLVRALEQHPHASVFSTPRVTVASGQQTRVQMVHLLAVRTGIHPDAVVQPGIWGRTNTPIYTLAQVPVGPSLDLAPIARADAQGIDLAVTATLTEFLGYDPPIRSQRVQVWKNGAKKRIDAPLPRFRVRQMQTPVRIEDGQTVLVATWPGPDLNPTQGPDSRSARVSGRNQPRSASQRFLVFLTPRLVQPVAPSHPASPPIRAHPSASP